MLSNGVFEKLGELLGKLVAKTAEFFLTKCFFPFMDAIGTGIIKAVPKLIDNIQEYPDLSPQLRELLTKTKEGGGEWQGILAGSMAGSALGGTMSAALLPDLELLKQWISKRSPFQLVPITSLIILKWRNDITDDYFYDQMGRYGIDTFTANQMMLAAKFYPSPGDLVTWIAKEVFEPETITEFGLDEEIPYAKEEDFRKAGVFPDQLKNFWIAHWVHPSYRDIVELYRRDQISKETFWKWFKLVEIPPIWRDGMIYTAWDTPNRIETRMMCRYLDMPKEEVIKLLQYAGLQEEFRDSAADFMIIMGIESDLRTRYRNGWISSADIKSELIAKGIDSTIAERVYQRIVKEEKPERVAAERDLTKAEIVKGVKKGVISWEEGISMLQAMGYDPGEAQFILEINIGALTGSPKTPAEFKAWEELYQTAAGLPTKRPAEEIIKAQEKLAKERGKRRVATEDEIRVATDTIRRKRRQRLITRDQEIKALLDLEYDIQYATTVADNDDLRLRKEEE